MKTIDYACAATDRRAVEWAVERLDADEVETVTESGWASTYRLTGSDGTGYLKVVPPVQRASIRHMLAVAEAFPAHVPTVIAARADEGWLLTADHGGEPPDFDESDDDLLAVLRRYATIEAQSAGSPRLLAALERIDTTLVLDELLDFLSPASARPDTDAAGAGARVQADYFIGAADARRYASLLQARAGLLRAHLAGCADLPPTLSHGDLHRWNVAIRPDGDVVLFDWDEAAVGPAGLSLHGLFMGCASATLVLDRIARAQAPADSPDARALMAYVETLAEHGYATTERLLALLPGALCAGQIRFISRFGRYPGENDRADAGDTLRAKLSDLLDLCDWLASRDDRTAIASADDYEQRQEWPRAYRLVQDRLARAPEDLVLLNRFAALAYRLGDAATANEAYQASIDIDPDQPDALTGLARARLAHADVAGCAALVGRALASDPANAAALALRTRLDSMARARDIAATPAGLPRWAISEAEHAAGRLEPDTLALLAELFRTYGVVQIDNVFPPDRIARLQHAFAQTQSEYFEDIDHQGVLQVGDKRFMLTMALDEEFGTPDLVASDLLMPLMRTVLGKECILSAYTAVISLPGSQDQNIHKDHSELFEEDGWLLEHPAFAAQIIIPLLQLDATTGTTRMFKQSQRVPLRLASGLPHQDPEVPLGSCVLLDYSVAHLGIGNRSEHVRPILNLIYSRPWFRDCRNYHLQPPLRFAPGYLDDAPDAVHKLVAWWDLERQAAAQAAALEQPAGEAS
jgi:Ser/Thr protein kinase RdoA (MazF antagonist)